MTPRNPQSLEKNTELTMEKLSDAEEDIKNLQKDLALKASINEVLTLLD